MTAVHFGRAVARQTLDNDKMDGDKSDKRGTDKRDAGGRPRQTFNPDSLGIVS